MTMTVPPVRRPVSEPIRGRQKRDEPVAVLGAIDPAGGRLTTLQDALARGVELWRAGALVRGAADEVLADADFDAETMTKLVRAGFLRFLNDHIDAVRDGLVSRAWVGELPNRPTRPFDVRGMTPQQRRDILAEVRLETSDGEQKALLRFKLSDWSALRVTAVATRDGWAKRAELAAMAIDLLTRRGVDVTDQLPADDLAVLAAEAAEAWR